jgi:NAD(P)-dependent dehydrogenase (short-subunit alcohol dehydrogenase family)
MANFLIISGSSSIGQAVVNQLRAQGHNIFQTARSADKISPDAVLDATDFDSVETVFQAAIAKMGSIDGVLNCAGALFLKPAHLTNYEQYKATIDASLTTSFAIVRAAGKFMNAGGSVVLISSAAAEVGLANHEAIAAAKAGIIGLMRSAAATYAPQNLRFNVVSPGLTETNLTTQITQNEMSRKISESMHALGRIGVPDDVARACVFLLNPENNWITGQVMNVDGGLAHIRPKMKV